MHPHPRGTYGHLDAGPDSTRYHGSIGRLFAGVSHSRSHAWNPQLQRVLPGSGLSAHNRRSTSRWPFDHAGEASVHVARRPGRRASLSRVPGRVDRSSAPVSPGEALADLKRQCSSDVESHQRPVVAAREATSLHDRRPPSLRGSGPSRGREGDRAREAPQRWRRQLQRVVRQRCCEADPRHTENTSRIPRLHGSPQWRSRIHRLRRRDRPRRQPAPEEEAEGAALRRTRRGQARSRRATSARSCGPFVVRRAALRRGMGGMPADASATPGARRRLRGHAGTWAMLEAPMPPRRPRPQARTVVSARFYERCPANQRSAASNSADRVDPAPEV